MNPKHPIASIALNPKKGRVPLSEHIPYDTLYMALPIV